MFTKLRFLSDLPLYDAEQPYEMFCHPTPSSAKVTNCEFTVKDDVCVADVRTSTQDFSLDTVGFQFVKHVSGQLLDPQLFGSVRRPSEQIAVNAYLAEAIRLVETETSAVKVICFDWRFRRSSLLSSPSTDVDEVSDERHEPLPPGFTMHCDFSHQGGRDRLSMHLLPEEISLVDKGTHRARIMNAWRPLKAVNVVPLVISDRQTVVQEDLVERDIVLPDKIVKAYFVKYRPYHKWYYMSSQTPEDVAIFTTWDSAEIETVARAPPHGAAMPSLEERTMTDRESIEVRMIVITPN